MFFSFFHKLVGGVSEKILASVQLPKISLLFEMDILRPWLPLKAIRHLSSPGVPGRFGAHSNFYSVMNDPDQVSTTCCCSRQSRNTKAKTNELVRLGKGLR